MPLQYSLDEELQKYTLNLLWVDKKTFSQCLGRAGMAGKNCFSTMNMIVSHWPTTSNDWPRW